MSKTKYEYPRHILLTIEQDQWAEQEADKLGLSVGAYFRTLLDDDRARKDSVISLIELSPHDRAERRRESAQVSTQTNDADVALVISILKAIKSNTAINHNPKRKG